MTIRDILLVHHSHTDIGYTNYQDNVFALHCDYKRRALDLAERYADGAEGERFRWTSETTILTEDFVRHASSSEVDRLRDLHRRGLIDFGGMFCNWTPLASAEILARSFLVAATRFGAEAAVEPLYGPVWDRLAGAEQRAVNFAPYLPEQASFLDLEPGNVHLVGLKPAADGRGIIVRLQELAGKESDFQIKFNMGKIQSAEQCDLTELPVDGKALNVTEQGVSGRIEAHRLMTIRVLLST